ncbi:FtsX-like permease family protein [Sanguibacter massiliensis]|uniref:FtsX-like permease family protein n=1 Tax=Sanguibacter massiliensis TaxID=1973217 RepID=UPI000C81C392|nr:FtsX-like permease family protein [Sanguibacter massiliensis]
MTGLARLAGRRAAAARGPLVALGVLAALVVACVVGVLGQVEQGVRDVVRDSAALNGDGGRLVLRTRLLADAATQDRTVRDLVGDATRGARTVVERAQSPDAADTPFVTWTVSVDRATVEPDDVERLAGGLGALEAAFKASDAQSRGVVVSGGLVATTTSLAARVGAFRQVAIVPVLVLGVVGAVGLGRVARQLVAGRRPEDALLASRGVSGRQLRALAGLETGAVTTLGAALGGGAAYALLAATTGAVAGLGPRALVAGAVTVLVATVTTTVLAGRQLDDIVRAEPRGSVAAGPVVTAAGLAVLAVAAGWRLAVAGEGTPDVLAVSAPGVLLVVLVLLGVQATGPAFGLLARRAARGRGLDRVLALRSAARRHGVRLPALVVGLAAGTLVLASSFGASVTLGGARLATLAAGADVRVTVASSGPVTAADVDRAPGTAAGAVAGAAVVVRPGSVGSDEVTVVAARPGDLEAVLRDGAGLTDALAGGPHLGGPAVGEGGLTVPVHARLDLPGPLEEGFSTENLSLRVTGSAWFVDTDGRWAFVRADGVELEAVGAEASGTLRLEAPDPGPWHVVALDVAADDVLHSGSSDDASLAGAGGAITVEVGAVTGADGPAGPPTWEREPAWTPADEVPAGTSLRWVAPGGATDPAAPVLPGVIDTTLARALDLAVGGTLPVTVAGTTVDVRVGEIRDTVPGAPAPAVLVDADALRTAQVAAGGAALRSEEVWLRADAPDETAAAAASELAADLVAAGSWGTTHDDVATVAEPRGTDVPAAFWTAGLATVLLALAGLRSTTAAQAATRAGETVALRALGLDGRRQGRLRTAEAAWVLGAGTVVGLAVGAVVALVATPVLVRAATGSVGTMPLAFDVPPLLAGLAVLAAGAAGLVALHARTVVRQAEDRDLREVSA